MNEIAICVLILTMLVVFVIVRNLVLKDKINQLQVFVTNELNEIHRKLDK